MKKQNEGKYFDEIRKNCGLEIEYDLVKELCKSGYITCWEPPDAIPCDSEDDIPDLLFKISDMGSAYVESIDSERWKELRNWLALIIALLAFIKSFFF